MYRSVPAISPMYGVFTFRSVKSLVPSIAASLSGVMLVQRPPRAWTTVPSEPPATAAPLEPVLPERKAHPATTAISATASPDPSRSQRGPLRGAAAFLVLPAGRPAEPVVRDVFALAWLPLFLLDIAD